MLKRTITPLERLVGWGTAIAIPLVAIAGIRLLFAAHETGAPAAAPGPPQPLHLASPPIDANAPPVVTLPASKPCPPDQPRPAAPAKGAVPTCTPR
ncbi:MAG: hypothetical protein JSR73_07275 [Proteobacteria bacterium]|nr:hypothetical protein [Pseudomonadota bacterium]